MKTSISWKIIHILIIISLLMGALPPQKVNANNLQQTQFVIVKWADITDEGDTYEYYLELTEAIPGIQNDVISSQYQSKIRDIFIKKNGIRILSNPKTQVLFTQIQEARYLARIMDGAEASSYISDNYFSPPRNRPNTSNEPFWEPRVIYPYFLDGAIYGGINGLDSENSRADLYADIIFDSLIQQDFYKNFTDEMAFNEVLKFIDKNEYEYTQITTIIKGLATLRTDYLGKLESDQLATKMDQIESVSLKSLKVGLDAFTLATNGYKLSRNSIAFFIKIDLANIYAQKRLDAFQSFISANPDLDNAIIIGFQRASSKFEDYKLAQRDFVHNIMVYVRDFLWNNWDTKITIAKIGSAGLNIAKTIGGIGATTATGIAITSIGLFIGVAGIVYSWSQDAIVSPRKSILAVTLQRKLFEGNNIKYFVDQIRTPNPISSDLPSTGLGLFEINTYLSWYCYHNLYLTVNSGWAVGFQVKDFWDPNHNYLSLVDELLDFRDANIALK